MKVKLSLEFDTPAQAHAALALLCVDGVPAASAQLIAPADRPDAGKGPEAPATPPLALMQPLPLPPAAPVPPGPDLAAVFGQQSATAVVPPLPLAPAVPLVPPPAAPTTPTLDSSGLPWDSRIHADSKGTVKDGTWRTRKNVDPAFKTQVETELRAALGGSAPAPAIPTPAPAASAPTAVIAPTVAPSLPLPTPPAVPPAPPSPPAADGAAPTLDPNTFAGMMAKFAPQFGQDAARATKLMTAALGTVGLSAIGQLSARPDLIPPVSAQFEMTWALPA